MTYKDLYEKADRKLEKGEITFGEFDEMTKPLDEEIRPQGEWIPTDEIGYVVRCSECNYETFDDISEEFNFCPNCGAGMRREV